MNNCSTEVQLRISSPARFEGVLSTAESSGWFASLGFRKRGSGLLLRALACRKNELVVVELAASREIVHCCDRILTALTSPTPLDMVVFHFLHDYCG